MRAKTSKKRNINKLAGHYAQKFPAKRNFGENSIGQ